MHHTLRLYSRYRELILKYYVFQAKWTRIALVGRLVRLVANLYGKKGEGAYLLTLDEACEAVDISKGIALGPCTCRKVFHNCDNPVNAEIMIGLSGNVFFEERPHEFREITKDEAKDFLKESHRNGLIHTIIKCRQDFYAICNCCSCCCVPLRLKKEYGIGNAVVRNTNIIQDFRKRQNAGSDRMG